MKKKILITKIVKMHYFFLLNYFYLFISDQFWRPQEKITFTRDILNRYIVTVYIDNYSQQMCVLSTLNLKSTEPYLIILN